MTAEEMEQIRAIMREENKPINDRLDKMDKRLDKMDERLDKIEKQNTKMSDDIEELKEYAKITREVTNEIGKWVELNATPGNPYPTDKTAV